MSADFSTEIGRRPVKEFPETAFFQNSLPVYVILGSFLAIPLPFALIAANEPDFFTRHAPLVWLYICGFGTTHFVLTLTVYMQSANLRYFASTLTNRVIYFLVPVVIFISFDLYSALRVGAFFPVFHLIFRSGIRFLDFHHFNRQNFGVLQLFKFRSKAPFPSWLKTAENYYFFAVSLWLMQTFLNGGELNDDPGPLTISIFVITCPLILVLCGFAKAWLGSTDRLTLFAPFGYFLFQSASAALAIYRTSFYFLTLAMHYVEYHVLMVPRCFKTPLDSASRIDRFYGHLRINKLIFYILLFVIALWVTDATLIGVSSSPEPPERSGPLPYQILIGLFDGLFVFHYFIESFIWKFSDPYYRQTLRTFYLGRPLAAPAVSRQPI